MALYHKHRPQLFGTIIGQEHIEQTLMNEVKTGKIAHAYLFSGPRGVGKTTSARVLAKALNCKERSSGSAEPCDKCESCTSITAGRAIDVIEMDAASHTGVDNVREQIIDTAHFQPTHSPYKIFIIDEVHMLSTSAFNALLKTLEEPPAHLIFILATTELQKLPDTIISRCQRFAFKKIPHDVMKKHLEAIAKTEGVDIADDVMQKIIRKSDGCARDGVNLLDQVMSTGAKKITAEIASLVLPTSHVEDIRTFLDGLKDADAAAAIAVLQTVANNGLSLNQFAIDLIECLRVAMILQASGNLPSGSVGLELSDDDQKALISFAKSVGTHNLIQLIDLAMKRRSEMKSAPIPELPLELLAIEWCSMSINKEQGTRSNEQSPPPSRGRLGGGYNEAEEKVLEVKGEDKQSTMSNRPLTPNQTSANSTLESPIPQPEPPAKSIVERVKEFVSGDAATTIEGAQSAWQAVIKAFETESPSLVFILKMAGVTDVNGAVIKMTVPYQFHKDKLEDKTTRRKIEGLLSETIAQAVEIDIAIKPEAVESNELDDMAALLGGEVVGI